MILFEAPIIPVSRLALFAFLGFFSFLRTDLARASEKDLEIVGWVERVRLLDPDINVEAKLDTGAATSSLDVEILKKYRQGKERWVRFRMIDRKTGEEHIIARQRLRTVSIVQHSGERQSRPVVRMRICLAGRVLDTEVSLVDRSEFAYPLLLGRAALGSFTLIDPGNTYLSEPDCAANVEDQEHRL